MLSIGVGYVGIPIATAAALHIPAPEFRISEQSRRRCGLDVSTRRREDTSIATIFVGVVAAVYGGRSGERWDTSHCGVETGEQRWMHRGMDVNC